MTCAATYENSMMSGNASAFCANASFSCADTVILDAMILASILIMGLMGNGMILSVALLAVILRFCRQVNDVPWTHTS